MRYWLQRLGVAVALLLAVSALTFGAMNLLGDPLFNILGPTSASTLPEDLELIEAAKAEYNLDDPLPVRYVKWGVGVRHRRLRRAVQRRRSATRE